MKPRAIRNNVLVQVDWELRTTLKINSLELQIDPAFDSNINDTGKYASTNISRQTKGIIASLPLGFSPHYDIDRIAKEAKEGDVVYFHYNAIDADSRLQIDGEFFYWISYDQLFCVVRDGQIIMLGGKVLVEPLYDVDIVEIEIEGKTRRVKFSKSGLITEIDVQYDLTKATLRHIGTPMSNEPDLGLSPGDIVYYEKDADFENEIEGVKYFVMNQCDLLVTEL